MFELTPNALLASRSMVFLDVKGELLRKYGNYLKKHGYEIRKLDLKDFSNSDGYNPFAYIKEEADIPRLVTNILNSVTPPETAKRGSFLGGWVRAVSAVSILLYLAGVTKTTAES